MLCVVHQNALDQSVHTWGQCRWRLVGGAIQLAAIEASCKERAVLVAPFMPASGNPFRMHASSRLLDGPADALVLLMCSPSRATAIVVPLCALPWNARGITCRPGIVHAMIPVHIHKLCHFCDCFGNALQMTEHRLTKACNVKHVP